MTLIHTARAVSRSGQARFVPGGLACAAARRLFTPTSLSVSPTLKLRSGEFAARPVVRLASSGE